MAGGTCGHMSQEENQRGGWKFAHTMTGFNNYNALVINWVTNNAPVWHEEKKYDDFLLESSNQGQIWILYFVLPVSSTVYVWVSICACQRLSCGSVPCMFCLCVPVCLVCDHVSVCVYLCLSLTKAFVLYLLNSTESIPWRRNGYLTEIFNRVLQVVKSLAPTDPTWPDNKYCLSSSIHKRLLSTFMVDLWELLPAPVFAAFS